MSIQHIAVIGAGTMGNGIAHVGAASGYQVTLVDISQDVLNKAVTTITRNLNRQVKKELMTQEDRDSTLGRIQISTSVAEAVMTADLIVEAASEDFSVKKSIFGIISDNCPPTAIMASNTSSISITGIGAVTARPENVIGMHFFNPVPVMKLCEIIRGLATSDATYETTRDLAVNMGKVPVEVKDYPGFISNRVLMPMINEAIYCLMEGVASADDIDTVMKLGMAHPMGPLSLADFIGLDVCLSIMEVLHSGLGDPKYRPCPLLRNMVAAGHLGRKAGRGFFSYQAG